MTDHKNRFELHFDPSSHRRVIAGHEVIIHCHHYNSRLQRTIEGAQAVDGTSIFVSTAAEVFRQQLSNVLTEADDESTRWEVAEQLYAHLGYGKIELSARNGDVVRAPESHFVEGWRVGFPARSEPVCSLTRGFVQASFQVAAKRQVVVDEVECMIGGAECCRFEVRDGGAAPPEIQEDVVPRSPGPEHELLESSTVDARAILEAVVAMPIFGGAAGLIPAFNVYLANTPALFYNMVSIRFVEEMTAARMGDIARAQLVYDAETCGMNTFRGILNSAEWEALIAPMVHDTEDTMHGIIAVSNALGWGNWHITALTPYERLQLVSANGYEADGYAALRGPSAQPECLMLRGVAAGVMELVYGEGTLEERFGQYLSTETQCRCTGTDVCAFDVVAA